VLDIRKPDYYLNVGSGLHGEMTGKIMIEFEKIVLEEKPDVIVVYGDTNTTLAGAIVGAKLKIPVAYVEAGLRQEPKDMPEEINRVLTDRVSKYLFCPTQLSVENLKKEGIVDGAYFTGDVMYDLFLMVEPTFKYEVFELLDLEEGKYIVMTLHRDFNVDNKEKFEKILNEVSKVAEQIKVIFPVHPRTRKRISEFGLDGYLKNVTVIDPIDYLNLMGLVKKSWKVITDSGGLQKEAYFAGKRAVVIMPDTSWRELVESEWNILADGNGIYNAVFTFQERPYPTGLYGNGDAGKNMVAIISR